jgi:flagellar hook-associated protein 3 FlgL
MRITTNLYHESFLQETQALQRTQLEAQRSISSGQRIHDSSDDPAAFRQSLEIQSSQRVRLQFRDNVRNAIASVEANHAASQKLLNIVTRASEITIRTNGSMSQGDFNIQAGEIDKLLQEAVTLGNQQDNGQFMFGGTYLQPSDLDGAASYVPFRTTLALDGSIANVTYRGNFVINQAEIDANSRIGTKILGSSPGAPTRGLFINGGVDVFLELINIRDNLLAGNYTQALNAIPNLRQVEDNVAVAIGGTASDLARLKVTQASHDDQLRADELTVSEILDTDFVKAATELQKSLTAYEAALQTGARVMSLSLLDFI